MRYFKRPQDYGRDYLIMHQLRVQVVEMYSFGLGCGIWAEGLGCQVCTMRFSCLGLFSRVVVTVAVGKHHVSSI